MPFIKIIIYCINKLNIGLVTRYLLKIISENNLMLIWMETGVMSTNFAQFSSNFTVTVADHRRRRFTIMSICDIAIELHSDTFLNVKNAWNETCVAGRVCVELV